MYQGGRAVYGGVVYHFASGIDQTDSDAAGDENPMDGDEPHYRPPERVSTVLLPEAGEDTAPRRILTALLPWSTIPVLRGRRMPVSSLPEGRL